MLAPWSGILGAPSSQHSDLLVLNFIAISTNITGNYFACSTHALAVNIIGKRELITSSSSSTSTAAAAHDGAAVSGAKTFMYYVNEGVFGSFNCVISYNLIKIPTPLKYSTDDTDSSATSELHPAIIWGQTCDSKDKLCETTLPELAIGDWLYFYNMGGYTVGVASTFNGFGIPVRFHYVTESYRYSL